MPVHIEEMTSDVTVVPGELPLSPAQIDKLVAIVMKRLEETQRAARQTRDATGLRQGVTPPSPIGE